MTRLKLQLEHVSLPLEVLAIFEDEFRCGDLKHGTLIIGSPEVSRQMLYLIWCEDGEPSVSISADRDEILTGPGARKIAQQFLERWRETRK